MIGGNHDMKLFFNRCEKWHFEELMIWLIHLFRKKCFLLFPFFVISSLLFQLHHVNERSSGIKYAKSKLKPLSLTTECKRILGGDSRAIRRANKTMEHYPKMAITSEDYIKLTQNCKRFKKTRKYILKGVQKEFPIAFSITIYKDIEQFERLLRAIYRPQNYYCIHVDAKSPKLYHHAVQSISSCFSNVFLASSFVDVRWGEFTVLQADLICMRDLWTRFKTWRYFINLTGQEFPLKTNSELVKMLKSFNGNSLVKGVKSTRRAILDRFRYVHRGTNRTKITKPPFHHNFTLVKGSTHVILSRTFVNFTIHDHVVNKFLEWVKDTGFPDETFVPSLYANFPGLRPSKNNGNKWKWNSRYKNWGQFSCHGKVVRRICINGIRDLKFIITRPEPFVNKFHLDYQYLTLDCLEQWLYNKTLAYNKSKFKI